MKRGYDSESYVPLTFIEVFFWLTLFLSRLTKRGGKGILNREYILEGINENK
ncbi:hypothetical protein A5881_000732 [Enterococcus termitis]|nr:hypothetical protein A5881_000938 [Enterococcus termitis]